MKDAQVVYSLRAIVVPHTRVLSLCISSHTIYCLISALALV